jgi:hypothetical protein
MTSLTIEEQTEIIGGGFWGGLACGLGLATAFVLATSPDPVSTVALLTYGATAIGCLSA